MPPENPYAAPQTVDQPVGIAPELEAEVGMNLDSIRMGAGLALKANWLVLFACFVIGICAALKLSEFVPLMLLILLGSAVFCFLLGLVAFWQATNAASIRRLMRIAMIAFVLNVGMNIVDDWYTPYLERTSRLAWIALNNLLSMVYTLAFLRGIARLGRVVDDQTVTGCANVATWSWGVLYAWIVGFYLLALSPALRAQLQWLYSDEGKPLLIASVVVLGILLVVGLAGFIRALRRLRKI